MQVFDTGNEHVLGFTRPEITILANFSEAAQTIPLNLFDGLIGQNQEQLHGASKFENKKDLTLEPLDFLVIRHQVRFEM